MYSEVNAIQGLLLYVGDRRRRWSLLTAVYLTVRSPLPILPLFRRRRHHHHHHSSMVVNDWTLLTHRVKREVEKISTVVYEIFPMNGHERSL